MTTLHPNDTEANNSWKPDFDLFFTILFVAFQRTRNVEISVFVNKNRYGTCRGNITGCW